ncbi:MAG: redoxin family protein [Fimbriimonadaceae bacterium]|nr:redoxin family protein [Chthonomonadaceae bacterium]MCO5296040.1 redoxin family protein [Fimbriimonadaceae bacterium]
MPHLKELNRRYKDQGLVLIGIHSDPDAAKMKAAVKENGLDYLIAQDGEKKTMRAMHADSFPDYYLIDRSGKLRFADLANAELDRAVEVLLKEKG